MGPTRETGALWVLLCATLMAGCRWLPRISATRLMSLAIIGNLAAAWAWFGVRLFGVGLPSYGHTNNKIWALGFCAAQLVCLLTAFLPAICCRLGKAAKVP